MTIFLDVGAHTGQTLEEVVKERWAMRIIHVFEPMPAQFETLRRFDNPHVKLHNFGMADSTGSRLMYGSNELLEASLYPDMRGVDPSIVTRCDFVRASSFVRSLGVIPNERVIMKLNCEGGEIPILNELLESGEIWRLTDMMIDFHDVTPKLRAAKDSILQEMARIGYDRYRLCEQVMRAGSPASVAGGTHQERIANWLEGVLS